MSEDVRWYSTAKADGWAAEEGGCQQEGPSYPDHWRYQGIQCHFFILIWWKRSWILQRFVQEHSGEDFLLHGFQGKNANPYRSLHLKSFYYPYEKTIWQFFPEKSPPAWCYKFFHQNAETFRHNVLSVTVMHRLHIELVECLPDGNKWTSLCNHGCWYECLDPIPFWVWEILSLHAKSLRIINWIFRAARVNQKAYQNLVNCYKDLLQE